MRICTFMIADWISRLLTHARSGRFIFTSLHLVAVVKWPSAQGDCP